jgi:hypothetical protein
MTRPPKKTAASASATVSDAKAASKGAAPEELVTEKQERREDARAKALQLRQNKIFPRNLTARAAYLVPGNPVVTRPEDAVANCFPGLELDIRNLDRRFFPGLVFEFADDGARLAYVDARQDPDLQVNAAEAQRIYEKLGIKPEKAQQLYDQLTGEEEGWLSEGRWYLEWIKQGRKKLSMGRERDEPLDSYTIWRLIRSLEPAPVTISLRIESPRDTDSGQPTRIELEGWRRRYTDEETGVINLAYQPGELMQGLCSPWQHDFRDCQCFYWAANHPDVVLGELYPGEALTPTESSSGSATQKGEQLRVTVPLDWIRADRSRALEAEALGTIVENRPYQLDAFRINSAWQDLSIVLEGREIGGLYVPQTIETANPFRSPSILEERLCKTLAPLELTLTFEYLYARFSLLTFDEAKRKRVRGLSGAVMLARDRLMMIAISEMQHLRWVNQMLWELYQHKLVPSYEPVLTLATEVPTSDTASTQPAPGTASTRAAKKARREAVSNNVEKFIHIERSAHTAQSKMRSPELRRLGTKVVDDFIAVEHPSGFIDGAYARVAATLRQAPYPDHLAELALRIASDGVQHEARFLEIKAALAPFEEAQYLRTIQPGKVDAPGDIRKARELLKTIRDNLHTVYVLSAHNDIESTGPHVGKARTAMTELLDLGDKLAQDGIGLPFFGLWESLQ